MRKLWPPTYDNVSVRLWAAATSAVVVLLLWLLAMNTDSDTLYWLFAFPGMLPAMVITSISQGDVEGTITPLALIAWIVADFALYYFVAWVFIRAFRPA